MNTLDVNNGTLSRNKAVQLLVNHGAVIGIVLVLILFQCMDHRFMKMANIVGVLNSSTILIVMSLAMTLVMSVRGIDLSIAQVADASGVIAAMLLLNGTHFILAILIALAFGLVIGCINALIISWLGVPAIIGTLGMMFIIRSFELTLTDGAQPQILFTLPLSKIGSFFTIGQGSVGPIPLLIIITVVIVALVYVLKERSIIGRHMDAIQGNVRTSFLSGIHVRKVFGLAFLTSSMLAAMAGVMLVSRSGNAVPRGVETYLTDCFVAVYIGTLLSKNNKFNIPGTVVGALFVGFLSNFFTLMGLGAAYKNLFNGLFIIAAVALGGLKRRQL